ncbi:MAG: glycosyltransferase family 2 protein [bacterium]|nr:glycosyltransferase family 2 protein [bacterium]
MNPTIDVVVLSRGQGPLHPLVRRGIEWQDCVHIRLHRLTGNWRPHDVHRWSVIVRTRNRGKRMGSQPWFMFLDDDVVLAPGSVSRMMHFLRSNASLAATAADYLGEAHGDSGFSQHVGMGATLFRRTDLDRIRFRWQPGKCECQCCCDDLRRQGREIKYCHEAGAKHLRTAAQADPYCPAEVQASCWAGA